MRLKPEFIFRNVWNNFITNITWFFFYIISWFFSSGYGNLLIPISKEKGPVCSQENRCRVSVTQVHLSDDLTCNNHMVICVDYWKGDQSLFKINNLVFYVFRWRNVYEVSFWKRFFVVTQVLSQFEGRRYTKLIWNSRKYYEQSPLPFATP